MDRRFVAVMGILVLAGLGLAFTSVIIGDGRMEKHEDIWLVRNPQPGKITDPYQESGIVKKPENVTENSLSSFPVETTNFSNVNKKTARVIARNQSIILIQLDGKPAPGIMTLENPETGQKTLTTEQKKLAEKIALADSRVRNIVGTSIYITEIQPLDTISMTGPGNNIPNQTRASVLFTTVNSTTALDESTFFVHVDLAHENVIRVSPMFPHSPIPANT